MQGPLGTSTQEKSKLRKRTLLSKQVSYFTDDDFKGRRFSRKMFRVRSFNIIEDLAQVLRSFFTYEKTNARSYCRKVYPPPLLVWPNSGRRVPTSPRQVACGRLQSADWVGCSSRHFEFDAAPARLHGKSAEVSRENIFMNIFNFPDFFPLQMLISPHISPFIQDCLKIFSSCFSLISIGARRSCTEISAAVSKQI